jgi:eukaryotic-like serine/threonine-protein kinase
MSDALAAALAAELASRYVVEGELGRGSSATVYLARDLRHGRRVALKLLHAALGEVLGVERFQREIRTQARLQHPHILSLFDSGQAGGRLFYTMPYVEAGSLRDRLRREGRLPVEAAVQLVVEVATGLGYAHALGVIHRDIKPENILLSANGHALLTDFGIAYALEDRAGRARLTESGIALGTPTYMSPEQSTGEEALDARSDLYALATVLYECLAGRPPFTGPNARSIMTRRLVEAAAPLRSHRPDVPAPIDAAVARALTRHPDDRYESVAEFVAALTALPAPTPSPRRRRRALLGTLGVVLVAAAAFGGYRALHRTGRAASTPGPQMLVVLPFRNLGPPEDRYFADGLTEEMTSRLARLSGLRVISRTSADQYRGSPRPLREIGAELGAAYVLEGSVRWERSPGSPGRIRVSPRLIAVTEDAPLWTADYDAELTEVFQVQSEIAGRVTSALDVALRAADRAALATRETSSPEAYDLYLRGNDYLGRSNQEADLTNAARLFQQAVTADTGFAVAWAKLARCHTQIYWHYYDHSTSRLALARAALDRAVRLGPDLPETHMAQGFFAYWARLDYETALREFETALRLSPSSSELLQAIGYVERRRGRWEESLGRFAEALRYDPRSGVRNFDVGDNYFSLRMYPEADHYLERAMTLSPEWSNPYMYRAWLQVVWRGDTARGRAYIREGLTRIEPGRFAPSFHGGDRISASLVTSDPGFWPMLDALSLVTFTGDTVRYHLIKAEQAYFRRDAAAERAHADSARVVLEPRVRSLPDEAKLLGPLALAYSHLGRHAEAVRAGERAAANLPVERDAVSGPFVLGYLARVYLMADRPEQAIAILERLSRLPTWVSPAELRVDPIWDPLRGHPRFQRLAEGVAPVL